MDERNVATLEASKKLVDNGIVLETEKYFEIPYEEDSKTFFQVNNNGTDAAVLPAKIQRSIKIPRPCFTEVWRELPADIFINKERYRLDMWKVDDELRCSYIANGRFAVEPKCSENPTDTLIELLIHIKGAGK